MMIVTIVMIGAIVLMVPIDFFLFFVNNVGRVGVVWG